MKKIIISFFLLFILHTNNILGQENNWTYMYDWGDNNQYSLYYNSKNIEYKNNYIEVWLKDFYNENYEFEISSNSKIKKKVSHSLTLKRFFCGEKKVVELKSIIYFEDGTFRTMLPCFDVSGEIYITEHTFDYIPDTWFAKCYDYFCFK